jgi:hypothetical protein
MTAHSDKKLLIVDDEEEITSFLREFFVKHEREKGSGLYFKL